MITYVRTFVFETGNISFMCSTEPTSSGTHHVAWGIKTNSFTWWSSYIQRRSAEKEPFLNRGGFPSPNRVEYNQDRILDDDDVTGVCLSYTVHKGHAKVEHQWCAGESQGQHQQTKGDSKISHYMIRHIPSDKKSHVGYNDRIMFIISLTLHWTVPAS